MRLKIWERYFLKEFLKTLFLFLFCFFGLYMLIDYSSNASSFHHHITFQWRDTAAYYLSDFSKRLDVLLPFALLIATIRTLCNLNIHNEIVALQSGGISVKRLMQPFVLVGVLCTALAYVNTEFVLPTALKELKHIHDSRSREKHKQQYDNAVQHLALEDNTTLLFQNYDSALDRFFDAYWVRSFDDIYRIKFLHPNTQGGVPEGHFVEHLQRNESGEMLKIASAEKMALPDMHFNKETLFETITAPSEKSLSELWYKLPQEQRVLSEKEAQALSAFYHKAALPWLCLLAIIAPAPFCLRCTRQLPVFFIYACSIFGLVAVYLIMDAALVLGERHVLAPSIAVGAPFGLFSMLFTWRFFKHV